MLSLHTTTHLTRRKQHSRHNTALVKNKLFTDGLSCMNEMKFTGNLTEADYCIGGGAHSSVYCYFIIYSFTQYNTHMLSTMMKRKVKSDNHLLSAFRPGLVKKLLSRTIE